MQNDIFLPDSQFFEGKVSFHLAQWREKEREREGKGGVGLFDWKSNWRVFSLVFPPSEIVMENLRSSKLELGVERNKNVPSRQRADERNWNAGEEKEGRGKGRWLDRHAPRKSSEGCGNGWNIDTSDARRTLYLPVPAPGFLYDLYTSSSLPPPCLNFICHQGYLHTRGPPGYYVWLARNNSADARVRIVPLKMLHFYRAPHPSNNSMESPLHGIPNRFIFYLTKHSTFILRIETDRVFSFLFSRYIILNFHPDILPMEQRWIRRDKLAK